MTKAETFLAFKDLTKMPLRRNSSVSPKFPWPADSLLIGKSLAEAKFRENHKVTVIGIRRGDQWLPSPTKEEILHADDSLIITGKAEIVKQLESRVHL